MKRSVCYFLLYVLLFQSSLTAQTKQAAVQQFINAPSLKHASVGVCVKDMEGKTIASHNADKSLTPASILKVVTTATALELLGSDYQYKTTLAKDKDRNNHLLIHGYGDPTLGTQHLKNDPEKFLADWLDVISKQDFKKNEPLSITVIDDYYGYEGISERWIYQDMGNYYAAAAYGISVYDNTYSLYFNTMRRDTCPVIIKTDPKMYIKFRNNLAINNTGRDNGYIHGVPFSNDRVLTGNIPAGKTSFSIKGDIPNPGLYLGEVVAKKLEEQGYIIGEVKNTYDLYHQQMYKRNKSSFNEEVFHTQLSYLLSDIIKDTNVRSNNHYAEHLIRAVGRTKKSDIYDSPLEAGIEKTNEFWTSNGIDAKALMIYDGSGLSPANAVSAEFMCDLLRYMQTKSDDKEVFLGSLPKAGKDGTVRNLLKGTRLEGKVSVKSGSINGVQCFAGYYINGEKKYAFTVMVNKFTGSRSQVVREIEKLLLAVL